jgi:hypothetical protein
MAAPVASTLRPFALEYSYVHTYTSHQRTRLFTEINCTNRRRCRPARLLSCCVHVDCRQETGRCHAWMHASCSYFLLLVLLWILYYYYSYFLLRVRTRACNARHAGQALPADLTSTAIPISSSFTNKHEKLELAMIKVEYYVRTTTTDSACHKVFISKVLSLFSMRFLRESSARTKFGAQDVSVLCN